jgi:excisionase family DNA binding protein
MSDEYLTIGEAAELCRVKPDTIKDRMKRGVYKLGIHYFWPAGSRPRFKKSAVIAWLEGTEIEAEKKTVELTPIPMRRGYFLGGLQGKTK